MVGLTPRGRSVCGLIAATLLTVVLLGWDGLARRERPWPAAGEGTSLTDRASAPSPLPSKVATRQPSAPGRSSAAPGLLARLTTGTGRLVVVPWAGPIRGSGRLRRYRVEVEAGLPVRPGAFAAEVERILADPRGWGAGGRYVFQRVASDAVDFVVVLASPRVTDRLCRPLTTAGIYSCFQGDRSVINYLRWRTGAESYGTDVTAYRQYVVLHEVGHALGHDHVGCPGPGRPAPTMMQQTKGVGACRPNPWPNPPAT